MCFRWCKIPYADRGRRCHQCGGGAYSRAALPGNKKFIIPSHKGKEPASGTSDAGSWGSPGLDAGLALGEGTGQS